MLKNHKLRIWYIIGIYQFYIYDKTPAEIVNKLFLENPNSDKEQLDFLKECLGKAVTIEHIVDEYLADNWSFWRLGNMDKAILILSIYEFMYTDINGAIIINEATILAKEYGSENTSYKLINGVLDKIFKNITNVKEKYYGK